MHKWFARRSKEQTAALMDVGVTSVKRDWGLAKACLRREAEGERDGETA